MSRCSRGSIPNPASGRCKTCHSFTLTELKSIAKSQRVSQAGSKDELCKRLIRHFMGRIGRVKSVSRTRSKSRSRSRSRSYRPRKRVTSRRSRRRSTSSRRSRKPRKVTRSRSRSSSYYRSLAPRVVKTSRGQSRVSTSRYPTRGSASFQKRHFSSKRKGPSLPANAHPHERARGNDGNMWMSRPDKNGVFHWKRM